MPPILALVAGFKGTEDDKFQSWFPGLGTHRCVTRICIRVRLSYTPGCSVESRNSTTASCWI